MYNRKNNANNPLSWLKSFMLKWHLKKSQGVIKLFMAFVTFLDIKSFFIILSFLNLLTILHYCTLILEVHQLPFLFMGLSTFLDDFSGCVWIVLRKCKAKVSIHFQILSPLFKTNFKFFLDLLELIMTMNSSSLDFIPKMELYTKNLVQNHLNKMEELKENINTSSMQIEPQDIIKTS